MGFDLHVNFTRWLDHVRSHVEAHPGIVPVIKGNGYGLGRDLLATEARALDLDTVAVGTYAEVPEALVRFDGSVMVLTPWRPFSTDAVYDERVVHTVSRVSDAGELSAFHPGTRIVVEGITSMARHGIVRDEIAPLVAELGDLVVEGFAIHLPMAGDNLAEAERWLAALEASQLSTTTVFVSHLTDAELQTLAERRPALSIRPRIGTALWLGDPGALTVRSTVLDVHPVMRGERIGYRQRPMPRDGHLVVAAGGTSHGVGLEAPKGVQSAAERAKMLARGSLAAAGFTLSPFTIAGKARWFAEPPHMQASMLFLPGDVTAPTSGDQLTVQVRYTIATFDRIERS